MGMMYYKYEFQTTQKQQQWDCILSHTFENMELYYRKQFSMQRLLSHFRRAFHVTPAALKDSLNEHLYDKKLLAIYLLTKYSEEDFEFIADEFNISLDIVDFINEHHFFASIYEDNIRVFFKQFEEDYLINQKNKLAFIEKVTT